MRPTVEITTERTPCNYCTLQWIRERYNDKTIELKPADDGGMDVLVDGHWIAWFMELTDHCVC